MLLAIITSTAAPKRAEAATFDATTLSGFGLVMLYAAPMGCALFATTVNGTYLAYDQGSPRRWHVLGYVSGAVEIVGGAAILAFGDGTSSTTIIGVTPIVIGALSVAAAYFVRYPDDVVGEMARSRGTMITPIVTAHGAGIGISGTF
jgi:hypothetical protein